MILPRTSEGLYLLQRVRDEAHRFAITFHRQRRTKAMTASAARRHPGAGRRPGARRCCARFGSVKRLRAAIVEEIAAVPGIGPALAATVVAALAGDVAGPPSTSPTGEIID